MSKNPITVEIKATTPNSAGKATEKAVTVELAVTKVAYAMLKSKCPNLKTSVETKIKFFISDLASSYFARAISSPAAIAPHAADAPVHPAAHITSPLTKKEATKRLAAAIAAPAANAVKVVLAIFKFLTSSFKLFSVLYSGSFCDNMALFLVIETKVLLVKFSSFKSSNFFCFLF